jgi:hypothetical protein
MVPIKRRSPLLLILSNASTIASLCGLDTLPDPHMFLDGDDVISGDYSNASPGLGDQY